MDTGERRVEAGAVNIASRQDGLLGETRRELFIENLHINDSPPPPHDFPAAY